VLAPEPALRQPLGPLPGAELVTFAEGENPGDAALQAEVLIFGPELRALLGSLDRFPALRFVQTLNAGVEMILPHVPPGVTLANASGVHDGPVAEWVVGAILGVRRGSLRFALAQQAHRWDLGGNALTGDVEALPFDDLEGARVLVVGYGSIGARLEAMLAPFAVTVSRVASAARPGVHGVADLDALLPDADIVVLLTPLTDATRNLLDARRLALLPDGAIVVNAARGAVLDQAALERELRAGRLRAALDVTDPEPLPPDATLWDAPGLLLTPHTAGSSRRWRARAYRFAGDQVRRYLAGEPVLNVRTRY
jgi:phosphoglycerate dehydrogenase-like enzyme